jgi:opine dehydrogenase
VAARASLRGHQVVVWNREPSRLELIAQRGGVALSAGSAAPQCAPVAVCRDAAQAVRGADVVVVATNANAHRDVLISVAPELAERQLVYLMPGQTGGAWEARAALLRCGPGTVPALVELAVPFVARLDSNGVAMVGQDKTGVTVAPLPPADPDRAAGIATALGVPVAGVESVLAAGLGNTTCVFHPALMLLNATRIEHRENFTFFRSGCGPAAERVIGAVDAERLAVADALGVTVCSAADWLRDSYRARGDRLADLLADVAGYANFPAPPTLDHRFLREHVEAGLVPIMALARAAGVATPASAAVTTLAGIALDADLSESGRSLARLLPPSVPVDLAREYFRDGLAPSLLASEAK